MAKYTFIVMSNPVTGKEAEYNDWYNKHHLPDVLNVPGFVRAQRFRLADTQLSGEASRAYNYLALYEIDTDADPAERRDEIRHGAQRDVHLPRDGCGPRKTASRSAPSGVLAPQDKTHTGTGSRLSSMGYLVDPLLRLRHAHLSRGRATRALRAAL